LAPMKVMKIHHAKSDGVRTNCGGLVYDSPDVRFSKKWSEVTCEECKKAAAQKHQRSQKRKKELECKRELERTRAVQKSQRPSRKDFGYQVEERGGLLP
jgi:tRNA nucleotidyltransferase (CCA-adding enzyme)